MHLPYHEFSHNIVKIVCGSTKLLPCGSSYIEMHDQ